MSRFRTGSSAIRADTSLKSALHRWERAEGHAVLWFAEITNRRLYRHLGHSTMIRYARVELGFSERKTYQFLELARAMERLPHLRVALAANQLAWTKAREIARIASPSTEQRWIKFASKHSRRRLINRISNAKASAKREQLRQRGQTGLMLSDRASLTADAQESGDGPRRRGTQVSSDAKLGCDAELSCDAERGCGAKVSSDAKLGCDAHLGCDADLGRDAEVSSGTQPGTGEGSPQSRVTPDLMLSAVDDREHVEIPTQVRLRLDPLQAASYEALVQKLRRLGQREDVSELVLSALESLCADSTQTRGASSATPAGSAVFAGHSAAAAEQVLCDARIHRPGSPNRSTVAPRLRREVLVRDEHRCRVVGCESRRGLEVHHIRPRSAGGENTPENLVTLCHACHRLHHERQKRGLSAAVPLRVVRSEPNPNAAWGVESRAESTAGA